MSHDKIKAAARDGMARTGESYATAGREVIREDQAASRGSDWDVKWFAIRYGKAGLDRVTAFMDGLIGAGPGAAGAEVDGDGSGSSWGVGSNGFPGLPSGPRADLARTFHGTSGVHVSKGQLLVNGTSEGLVELMLDPPCRYRPHAQHDVRQGEGELGVNQPGRSRWLHSDHGERPAHVTILATPSFGPK